MKAPWTTFGLALPLLVATSSALAGALGVIGDSISVATNADDQCDDAFECVENLGEDSRYSFSVGIQPWSLGIRMGATRVISAAANGAEWDDALTQAQQVLAAADVSDVVIALGGNDVCGVEAGAASAYEPLWQHVDSTLAFLTTHLPAGGSVTLVAAPEVARLRQAVAGAPHFAFYSCQAFWDLDPSGLSRSAVREVCEGLFGEFFCRSGALIDAAQDRLLDALEDRGAACPAVLHSSSPPDLQAAAALVNRQVNNILHQQAQRYRGRNGIAVRVADIYEPWQFVAADVSYLDCFHPSRSGQATLADTVWERLITPSLRPQGLGVFDGSFNLQPAGEGSVPLLFIPPGGTSGTSPIAGDWNGDGLAGVGLYRADSGLFELYDELGEGSATGRLIAFGPLGSGWVPLSGDWDGDGRDGIGLYDPKSGHFYLRNLASSGEADLVVRFGPARARLRPLAGDWDGDGVDGIGVYDRASARFRLRELAEPGAPDHSFRFGPTGARLRPVAGDWNGDGRTGIGVYMPSLRRFLLRQSATGGPAELVHMLPGAGPGGLPLAGRWGGG